MAFLEEVLAVVLEGCGIFGECFGGCDILEEVLAEFWRGVAFLEGACRVLEGCGIFEGCLQCWRVWHFGGACSVLEGVAFWRGACSVLEGVAFWRGVAFRRGCSVLKGCGIFGGRLKCFGGIWHFWRALAVFWRVWHFWRGACSVLERHDILEEVLAVFW